MVLENQFLPNDFYDGRVRITYPLFNKDLLLQKVLMCMAKEGKLFLTGLNADIMEVFQITKLEKFFNFQSSVESALDSI